MTTPRRNGDGRASLPVPATDVKPRWTLLAWQCRYAEWWVEQAKPPSKEEQEAVATKLANAKNGEEREPVAITYGQLKTLKRRVDWQEYVRKIEEGGVEAARAMLAADLPLYLEIRRWAALHAREAGDHRAIAALTEGPMDRCWPKKLDLAVSGDIHITLSAHQIEELNRPPSERLEAEIVEDDEPRPTLLPPTW